jgi:hypothetical protein
MIYSWNNYAVWNQIILSSLAGRLATPFEWSDSAGVIQFIWNSRILLPFKREKANVLLEDAYHREFLEKNEAGSYRFRMDVFRRWIQREHSIWKVVKEADVGFRRLSRTLLVAGSLAAAGLAVLALSWFLLVPRFLPGVAAWGRGAGLMPSPRAATAAAGQDQYVENFSVRTNRGPFTLVIDGAETYSSKDSDLGPTSLIVPKLSVGEHEFAVLLPTGEKVTKTIDVRATRTEQLFPIPPAEGKPDLSTSAQNGQEAALSTLLITSTPSGATISLDAVDKGLTPSEVPMAAGLHTLVLTLSGYKNASERLNLEAGIQTKRHVAMEEAWALLSFTQKRGASVTLNGEHLVDLPVKNPVRVKAGKHLLTIVDNENKTWRDIGLDLSDGQVYTVKEESQ